MPDNAKFCTACGTPVNAPDEATVVISNPEDETVEASASEGEFTAASWTSASAASSSLPTYPALRMLKDQGKL
ncbi:MAG: hypothetical protein IJU69_00590 [Bacteroidales bacterium]|nr:hypothetical protein [Bacteroidales bacterium]